MLSSWPWAQIQGSLHEHLGEKEWPAPVRGTLRVELARVQGRALYSWILQVQVEYLDGALTRDACLACLPPCGPPLGFLTRPCPVALSCLGCTVCSCTFACSEQEQTPDEAPRSRDSCAVWFCSALVNSDTLTRYYGVKQSQFIKPTPEPPR